MRPLEVETQCQKLLSERKYVGVMELWKEHIFPENMTDKEVQLEWYKALFEEDCLRIMKLLKKDPTLVEVGWESEPSRNVEGSPESHRNRKVKCQWQGRTALHVSARRGCIELVKQVLELYGLNVQGPSDPNESEKADRQADDVASSRASSSRDSDRKGKNDVSSSDHADRNGKSTGKDLLDLLVSKDGIYKIDALAIATIHFKLDVFNLLVYAIGECEGNPYGVHKSSVSWQASNGTDLLRQANLLRQASEDVIMENFNPDDFRLFLAEYSIHHRDFNFYSAEVLEYLFHFSFTKSEREFERGTLPEVRARENHVDRVKFFKRNFRKILWAKVGPTSLWRFVVEFQDGQGRTPLHVAVDERYGASYFFHIVEEEGKSENPEVKARVKEVLTCIRTTSDGAGRPLSYGAAAVAHNMDEWTKDLSCLTSMEWKHSVTERKMRSLDGDEIINKLAEINGFKRIPVDNYGDIIPSSPSPLQAMIVRKSLDLNDAFAESLDFRNRSHRYYRTTESKDCVKLNALELACLVEDNSKVCQMLLREDFGGLRAPSGSCCPGRSWSNPFEAIHIVAALGNYNMMKMFLDDHCDPFIKDDQGNTALHYAMREPFNRMEPSLLDYVSCQDLLSNRPQTQRDILDETAIVGRQGCVSLLLEAGCQIFKGNNEGQVPYPRGTLANSAKFLSWWHERQEKEFGIVATNLNNATNAISVTATLVATASLVGPLRPPFSYAADPAANLNQIQYENGWVSTFILCDTLSFYFAIIAIVLSRIPSLPVPEQAMADELQRTKAMMIMAVTAFIPSIICALIAFAASSTAVVSPNITSSIGGKLNLVTLCIGGAFFLVAIFLFSIRLLIMLYPRTPLIRYFYECTSFGKVRKVKNRRKR